MPLDHVTRRWIFFFLTVSEGKRCTNQVFSPDAWRRCRLKTQVEPGACHRLHFRKDKTERGWGSTRLGKRRQQAEILDLSSNKWELDIC